MHHLNRTVYLAIQWSIWLFILLPENVSASLCVGTHPSWNLAFYAIQHTWYRSNITNWYGWLEKYYVYEYVFTRVTNCFSAHERVILVFISRVAKQRGNNTKNNTRISAETVRHKSTYVILFQTWHNDSINDDKNDDLYTSPPCLIRSVFVLLMTSQPPGLEATVFVDIIAINRGAEYE